MEIVCTTAFHFWELSVCSSVNVGDLMRKPDCFLCFFPVGLFCDMSCVCIFPVEVEGGDK